MKTCSFIKLISHVGTGMLLLLINVVFFTSSLSADTPSPSDTSKLLKNFQILSKFATPKEAQKLADSLIKNGQDITIIQDEIEITLKTLSVGLYPDEAEADAVVLHLQKNKIDAYAIPFEGGTYRVYAGAMRDENHYWQRFEKLLGLGYRRIHTEQKPSNMTIYYVVRPKNEVLPIPFLSPPDAARLFSKNWRNEFIEGRFKGEYSIWGNPENRGSANYFKTSIGARAYYKNNWDFTYGFRFEAIEQSADESYQFLDTQLRPTYLRYRIPNHTWSIGAINAVWDDRNRDSISNRLDSNNLTRYRLDSDHTEREQSVFAIRWEHEKADHKLDVVWTPVYQPSKLPRFSSIWHPVNQSRSAIRGIDANDDYKQLIRQGSFSNQKLLTGGVGVRMVREMGRRTMATTLQFARHKAPYYVLNSKIRSLLAQGQTVNQALSAIYEPTFTTEQPYTGILSWEEFGDTAQMELAILTNAPYTTKNYELKTSMAFEWRLGFVYPKTDKYTHISAFTHGRFINTSEKMLDRNTQIYISGEMWRETENRLWRFSLNYDIAVSYFDVFLNPKISFKQNKIIDLYLSYQIFSGSPGTPSGYHTTHSVVQLGWQAKF